MRSAAFILVAIGVLTKAILTFSYNKLVAHGLDPSGYFAYGKLYLVATFMYTVASLGLANAHTVFKILFLKVADFLYSIKSFSMLPFSRMS